MSDDKSDLISKIEKLLAKADGTDNDVERALFHGKASQLMQEHMITEAQLGSADPAELIESVLWMKGSGGPYGIRLRYLCRKVADAHGVYSVSATGVWRQDADGNIMLKADGRTAVKWTKIVFFGRKGIVNGVIALCHSLIADALAQGSKQKPKGDEYQNWMSPAANTKRVRAAFIEGYVERVSERLEELNRKNNDDMYSGSLLPILLSDFERARELANDRYEISSASGFQESGKGAALTAGRRAGDRANLAKSAMPAGRRALNA